MYVYAIGIDLGLNDSRTAFLPVVPVGDQMDSNVDGGEDGAEVQMEVPDADGVTKTLVISLPSAFAQRKKALLGF